jgi:diguanylate cyclase (GGDEF)-like protein
MADQLEAARGELDREKADLKQRVTGQTRELQQANRLLMDIANRDVLTGLANRRRLELELERYISLSKRTGIPLAVVMMDLDKFKQYNDAAGHLAGDTLLQTVATTLRARARATDLVVRWGGDEFCILVPGAGPDGALKAAEGFVGAIREAAAAIQLPGGDVVVSASAGVACYPGDGEDGTELIARADEALYEVKATGRGRVLRLPRS